MPFCSSSNAPPKIPGSHQRTSLRTSAWLFPPAVEPSVIVRWAVRVVGLTRLAVVCITSQRKPELLWIYTYDILYSKYNYITERSNMFCCWKFCNARFVSHRVRCSLECKYRMYRRSTEHERQGQLVSHDLRSTLLREKVTGGIAEFHR